MCEREPEHTQCNELSWHIYGSESLNAHKAIEEGKREKSEAVDIMCMKESLNTHDATS